MDAEPKATAPQVACWSSAVGAMLWKEWRQQWLPFVLLAGLAPLIMLVGGHWSPFVAAGCASLMVWVAIPLVVGANVFAGEHDQGTDAFLYTLPASAGWFFRAKFLAVGVLSLLGFLPVLLLSPLLPPCPDKLWLDQPMQWIERGALVSVFTTGVVSAVASFRGRVLSTLLVSMVVGAVGAAWLGFCAAFMVNFPPWRWGAACLVMVSGVGLALVIAGWLFSRGQTETFAAVAARGFGAAAGWAVLVAVPSAISCVYVWFVMTPGDYAVPKPYRPIDVWISDSIPGPGSHPYVAFQCEHRRHEYGLLSLHSGGSERVAFLNTETEKWVWFDRYRMSSVDAAWWDGGWSPDGRNCLVARSRLWVWPFDCVNPGAPFEAERPWWGPDRGWTVWAFRAAEGTSSQLPGPAPEGWFDNDWVFSRRYSETGGSWTGLPFHNVKTGERAVCRSSGPPEERLMRAGAGVFGMRLAVSEPAAGAGGAQAVVQRYRPDLRQAEETVLSHPWEHPYLLGLAPDGRWFLVGEARDRQKDGQTMWLFRPDQKERPQTWLVQVGTGTVRLLAPPQGSLAIAPPVFIPGADRAAVLLSDGVAVCDLNADRWRSFRFPSLGYLDTTSNYPVCGWIRCAPDGRHAFLQVTSPYACGVIDLEDGHVWPWETDTGVDESAVEWLTDKTLLVRLDSGLLDDGLWIVNLDGTRVRRLLPRQVEDAP